MGDLRFRRAYDELSQHADLTRALKGLSDDDVIFALAWSASAKRDPYLANLLATEAVNRLQRLRVGVEYLAEGILAVDARCRINLVNAETERKSGWTRLDLLGREACSLVRHADAAARADARCDLRHVLETGTTAYVEEGREFVRKDGTTFPVAFAAAPVLVDGDVEGAVIVLRDVSERVQAATALRDARERWRRLAEAHLEAVVIAEEGRVVDGNAQARLLFGYASREAFALAEARALLAHGHREAFEEALRSGRRVRFEAECVRRDGSQFPAQVIVRSLATAPGSARAVVIRPDDTPAAP